MHGFYIEPPEGVRAALPPEEAKHAAKVLRLRPGDEVCAMDGAGHRWRAVIENMTGGVTLQLREPLPDNESPARLTVYQGLPKAEKLDLLAQKLTELGAVELIPVRMSRSVVKLNEKDGAKRAERLQRIADEAAKQCRRAAPLRVAPPMDWREALRHMSARELLLAPWEDARGRRIRDAFAERPQARDIAVVIGPEGGMSEEEVSALEAAGALPVTLGPRILRTETAAIAAATLALGCWGDL